MFITPHFTLAEMTVSQIAAREGLDNKPGPQALANLDLLCQALEGVRALCRAPVLISSGFRSQAVNQRVGGARNSAHLSGLAADFTVVEIEPREVVQRILASDLVFDQLILEYDSWVHLAVAVQAPRREVLTARRGTGYLPGLH
ncbi:D-Ala-D-Ala carboxypeptidase family metallohydrolase [Pseudomonas guariconensis]|uniref:D-Ala-D-Ala carboxypeptidase family metallohydrolase n=1 Tax=Pseudomonas guariconensis TaxID=1288410 RepID=UPI0018A9159A|nr:D-Ala-D-Ala carboxypeptidase family metallohydrolase [Pseudomonas guariconensis]MBF8722712.1 peptidase M15 [Pseudomonas guariconensis]MBF8791767.1 peptidase M15 [Pseudomonas monteilii]